jgi:hypothetical protein
MGAFDVTLKVTNFAGQNTLTKNEYIEVGPSGINGLQGQSDIVIYPNPATGQFTLLYDLKNPVTMKIVDQVGNTVYQQEVNQKKTVVDPSGLLPGFYVVRLTDNVTGKISISKLIIQ